MKMKLFAALISGAALLGMVNAADAKVLELKVRSGSGVVTVSSTYAGAVGGVTSASTINGVSYKASGNSVATPADITLNLLTTTTNTTNNVKAIQYSLTLTGLTALPTIQSFQDLFQGINPVNGANTISNSFVRVYWDASNVKYGTANLIYDSGVASAPGACGVPSVYSCNPSGNLSLPAGPFSLTTIMVVNLKTGSQGIAVTSNNSFAAVPEPTSLAILGSGLLLAGFAARRRKNDKAA